MNRGIWPGFANLIGAYKLIKFSGQLLKINALGSQIVPALL